MYAAKFGISRSKMMNKLWGDNFFDQSTKKWTSNQYTKDNKRLERGFVSFVLQPIETLFQAVMNDKRDVFMPMLEKLGQYFPL